MLAIVRAVSAAINRCELTHVERRAIDVDRAREQHEAYVTALASLGCIIERLPDEPALPDSVFVEDAAVVLDEVAAITRPGAVSRRAETASVEQALIRYRPVRCIEEPATLDGGDVLRMGRAIFVGVSPSGRSNQAGVEQLRNITSPFGYSVTAVTVRGCLHLKSAVTQVGPDILLVNRAWLPGEPFGDFACIDIDPGEPFAANALLIGKTVVFPTAFSRTRERLRERGIATHAVDVSELAKAEGAVTCCSLILEA